MGPCFSYLAGMPMRGLHRMPYSCFSYQADVPPTIPRRPAGKPYPCFSYQA